MSRPNRQTTLPGMGDPPHDAAAPPRRKSGSKPDVSPPPNETSDDPHASPNPARHSPAPARQGAESGRTARSVYVIDANALIYQVFHALPEMTSPTGQPVNAVFGFTRDLLYLLKEKAPSHLFCAFDMHGPTFRHEVYEPYKATRAEMPDPLVSQIPEIRRVVEAFGIPALGLEGYEADDILATVARLVEEKGGECYLVTSDKDCRQLISDRVKIYNVRKDQVYDADALAADWGIRPDQVVDFQSLVGDAVDNVPGVPLIGPKIAQSLLEQYGTLDEVLDHAGEVAGKKRQQNLIEHRGQALLSRDLVRLDPNVPIEIDWDRGRVGQHDAEQLGQLFDEFGFHRFREQVEQLNGGAAAASAHVWEAKYLAIDTPEEFERFVAQLELQKRICVDTETTSLSPTMADIVGYSIAWKPGEAYYVPVRAPEGDKHLDPADVLETLRPILESPSIGKVGQNLKYDMVVLRTAGVELAGVAFDTMVASYLLESGERNHSLDELARRYLNHITIKISELIGTGKHQKRMDEVPVAAVATYAAEDADVPLRLMPILERELDEAELTELYESLEVPLIDVLVELESNGIKVDVARLEALSAEFGRRLLALEREIHELAGHEFNIASPKQLQQVLFEEQGLTPLKRTKTGPSTDVEVLEQLAKLHPLPAKIIEYRQYAKLKGTYVDALPQLVNPRTGRVHASFHQAVAATGRLSSSDPNLQNIPIRTETGREIRSAFVPGEPDWQLLAADYSQIELRVLAHYSRDETMCRAFACDEDIHARVASEVFGVPLEEVTGEMRRKAKAVNFGIVYGQSAFGLAKSLDIDQTEAAEFIAAYFDRYPGVDVFLSKVLEDCRANGYVKTILGRRRAIQGVRADAGRQRNLPERTAINTVIQGSAADLIKRAMINIHRRLRRERLAAKMLLQIHDELIFEAPSHELDRLARLVTAEMAGVMELAVPLVVDVKSGRNWAETEPLT